MFHEKNDTFCRGNKDTILVLWVARFCPAVIFFYIIIFIV